MSITRVTIRNKYDYLNIVKEEFECNEIFTPEQTMARIFDSSVINHIYDDFSSHLT